MNAGKHIILVESGATKSAWRILDAEGEVLREFVRKGMNVSTMCIDDILDNISEAFEIDGMKECAGFYLYTAGVVTDSVRAAIVDRVRSIIEIESIDVQDDLVGAARAVCGHSPGIAVILGTGSNACFYNGSSITRNVYSGGFILGDEGSAAALGKLFVADFIKNLVPADIAEDFSAEFDTSYAAIVRGVYKSESPSGYLGSFAPFLLRHKDNPYVGNLIYSNFEAFMDRILLKYDTDNYSVGVVGGFAYACRDIVESVFAARGVRLSGILKEPVQGLCAYHVKR